MNDDNFFSIERLVEFGLGMGIAQQMVNSMNQAMKNVHIPGPMNGLAAMPGEVNSLPVSYFVVLDGKQAGPFAAEELSRLIVQGRIDKMTYVWRAGMAGWAHCQDVPEVLKLVALCPPPLPPEVQA
ncbi:hypothetical protein MASR1M42_06510 [Azonexus hydrophilus]|jgi:hypothetical protein|nr:DUF4339 domain-containing protein [Azonexus sp.]MBP8194695.1 DUF4339 domain-containing protein [Azonexus sp.]MDX9736517.1 DUF4339 domain-containing protein [Azonexus sp.]